MKEHTYSGSASVIVVVELLLLLRHPPPSCLRGDTEVTKSEEGPEEAKPSGNKRNGRRKVQRGGTISIAQCWAHEDPIPLLVPQTE